ncbi:MAG: metal ABC transporter substrate-binding protein [Acidimicrobiia bacterium]|nr:metal ABC transporter substrate-binding protein [Acidimicrobiia bacterium]
MRIIPMTGLRTILIIALAALAACGTGTATDNTGGGPNIVVTTDVLGGVVEQLVGADAEVVTLMPEGADPHSFEPSARQIAEVEGADLVVANGLGLEAGLTSVLERAAEDGVPILELAPLVDPIPFGVHGEDRDGAGDGADESADESADDPHFWLDPLRMARAVEIIGDRLDETDPGGGWTTRARDRADALRGLDAEVREILSVVPAEDRLLATDHDAFGYFADRYGFDIVGVVVPGGSTLAEPSASDLDDLVGELEDAGVPALFVGNTASDTLARTVADEANGDIEIVEIATGSLGGGTYRDLILTNARRIADALGRAQEMSDGGSS